jgi:LysM repeat protein
VLTEETLVLGRGTPSDVQGNHPAGPKAAGTPSAKPATNNPPSNAQQNRAAAGSAQSGADFLYAVRAGDTLSSIAALFRVETAELLRVNHVAPDTVLQIGQTLRIPNPFAAQLRQLTQSVDDLSSQLAQARSKIATLEKEVHATNTRNTELIALNRALQHAVRVLPWWRTAMVSASVAAGVMLIITLLAVLEWRRLRLRVFALAEANESLLRLDHKYRTLLAKAELRLQQLYGRRRGVDLEAPQLPKTPEEFELERYSKELKQVLEAELVRLGLAPPGNYKRSRIRQILAGSGAPAAARFSRR